LAVSAPISMLNFSALSKGRRGVTQEQTTPTKPNTKPPINKGAAISNSSSFRNSSAFFTINHNRQKVESCMRQKNRQCLEILFAAWSSTRTPLNSKSPTTAKHTTSAVSHAKKDSRGTPQNSSNKTLKIKKERKSYFLVLLEGSPHNSSQNSTNYRRNPKQPKLTQRSTVGKTNKNCWPQTSRRIH
jgi:hypothetical protein